MFTEQNIKSYGTSRVLGNTSRGENELISHHYYILHISDKKNCYASFKHEHKSFIHMKFNTSLGQKRGGVKILSYVLKINSQRLMKQEKKKLLEANHRNLPANNSLLSKLGVVVRVLLPIER